MGKKPQVEEGKRVKRLIAGKASLQTISDLYPFIPKYFYGEPQRINGQFLEPLERDFEFDGKMYGVRMTPARIEDGDGIGRDYYLGEREELVEEVLMHFASVAGRVNIGFTLQALRDELGRFDHRYSIGEVRKALFILQKTMIELLGADGSVMWTFNIFDELRLPEA